MLVKIKGTKSDGQEFEIERDLPALPNAGDGVEYDGARYTVAERTMEITAGAATHAAIRLTPALTSVAVDPTRCQETALMPSGITQCIHPPKHLGPHQFV